MVGCLNSDPFKVPSSSRRLFNLFNLAHSVMAYHGIMVWVLFRVFIVLLPLGIDGNVW